MGSLVQEFLYETSDAVDTLSHWRCRSLSIRHQMQDSLIDSGCRSHYTRKRLHETLNQTIDSVLSIQYSGC